MLKENKVVELNDDDLEKITGGVDDQIVYKYSINQIVINDQGWKLKIIGLDGWSNFAQCPSYRTEIIDKPGPFVSRGWNVGSEYSENENCIVCLLSSTQY